MLGGLDEDDGLLGHLATHLSGVLDVVLADAHDLRRQDGREQTDGRQRDLLARRHRLLEERPAQRTHVLAIHRARGDSRTVPEPNEPHERRG